MKAICKSIDLFITVFLAKEVILSASAETQYPITASALLMTPHDAAHGPRGVEVGVVNFAQSTENSEVEVSGQLTGLKNGYHGLHVHNLGNIYPTCTSSGPHFNPYNKTHGDRTGSERHIGDLGNIRTDANGGANFTFTLAATDLPLLGPNSIIGRTLVVHMDPDDIGRGNKSDSLTTGHAGDRVACGVIGYSSQFNVDEGISSGRRQVLPAELIILLIVLGGCLVG